LKKDGFASNRIDLRKAEGCTLRKKDSFLEGGKKLLLEGAIYLVRKGGQREGGVNISRKKNYLGRERLWSKKGKDVHSVVLGSKKGGKKKKRTERGIREFSLCAAQGKRLY